MDEQAWAIEEFGRAKLGDVRRVGRLVKIAAQLASSPSGTVTRVSGNGAWREGAYRFVENPSVDADAIGAASFDATMRRCSGFRRVIVAVDQSSISVTDKTGGAKGLGRVGSRLQGGKTGGWECMSALVVTPEGATVGLAAQQWWSRPRRKCPHWKKDRRPVEQRESGLWLHTLRAATERFDASGTRPWFQLDRGAYANAVLEFCREHKVCVTVRSCHNRALFNGRALWSTMRRQPECATLHVDVPAADGRRARRAELVVRAAAVTLKIQARRSKRRDPFRIGAVHVRERNAPRGCVPLEWRLLTTHPLRTGKQASSVVRAYCLRWRVEDFHRAWKSGACNIEASQLRSPQALRRWATISAAVAAKVERLKHLARSEPAQPAALHLDADELEAIVGLSERPTLDPSTLCIADAVLLIAKIGGYVPSKRHPPGATVIARGLARVETVTEFLRKRRRSG